MKTSDINGEGYGSKHNWENLGTTPFRVTDYKCRSCGALFYHNYVRYDDIFQAMENFGVPEECVTPTSNTKEI